MNITIHQSTSKKHRSGTPPSVAALVQTLATLPNGELFNTQSLRDRNPALRAILFQRYSTHPSLVPFRHRTGVGLPILWGNAATIKEAKKELNGN